MYVTIVTASCQVIVWELLRPFILYPVFTFTGQFVVAVGALDVMANSLLHYVASPTYMFTKEGVLVHLCSYTCW